MKPSRRNLAQYRVAMPAFIFLTVILAFVALPTIWQAANLQRIAEHSTPDPVVTLAAVAILLAWWGSFILVWIAEQNLHTGRRTR